MGRGWAAIVLFSATCVLCAAASAAELYVAPDGTPQGDGSRAKPLDLFTALGAQSPAKPGDTVLLLPGTYEGKMEGTKRIAVPLLVSGTKDAPVVVRPVAPRTVHINGAVELKSSYAHYIGLDIGDLLYDPTGQKHQAPTALWATGGEGAKVINCNIFGGSMGTGLWSPARDLELYGCLVHDFGELAQDRGHGHAFYTQNETGTKTIRQCIAYRGCGWNLHVYTQAGQINGFDILENIMYIAGAAAPDQTMDNYLVAGYPPADRIRLIGNIGYQPTDVQPWRPNARLGNYRPALNGAGEVRDNVFMGAFYGLSLGNWQKMVATGNTIWSRGIFVEINSAPTGSSIGQRDEPPALAGYLVNNNTYYDNGKPAPFFYGKTEKPPEDGLLAFAQWQALGLDKDSKVLPGKDGKPTGTSVHLFVNTYEKGRANVGIFNWDGLKEVEVDLSKALEKGQKFAVYNCLDIRQTIAMAKPVLEGTYEGGAVAFPMRKDKISPDFDAFLVLPVE